MQRNIFLLLAVLIPVVSSAQKTETVYLDAKDSTANMFIAVKPESGQVKAFMFLLDGFGASPEDVLLQTSIPTEAARHGILTIIPILKTGRLYFASDEASQQSLTNLIGYTIKKYDLRGKDFYIGGFSIGGTCAVKYAELAAEDPKAVKPKAVFAVDPPLDWERFYNSALRVVRLSAPGQVNPEVTYMIDRIPKEMKGTPQTALASYYENSPYSFSDTTQRAVRKLIDTPLMLITEPDIQWWLSQRGYDYDYLNVAELAAMINELRRLGNKKAVLVTTENKGYRMPGKIRHPHSWSIADPKELLPWLISHN